MWINKYDYNKLLDQIDDLEEENFALKDDSGEAVIDRITNLAKKANLDVHSKEYQDIMHRLFMDIAGRHSNVMKGYSQTTFMKDNESDILERVKEFQKEASVITKRLTNKNKL